MMNRPDDHEAKMARADLFKLAQYSFKLFKMINENQELEGWVQAKITKAADYISSVYHYMEYEMKVSEYGDHLENAEMYSESVRKAYEQKLNEARNRALKIKMKALSESRKVAIEDGSAPPPKGPDGKYPIITSGPNKGKRWTQQAPGPTNPIDKTPVKPGTTPEQAKLDPRYKTDPEFKKEVDTAMKIGVKENLKGGQKKLDIDKDGKLEKSDFAKLRSGKRIKEAAKPDFLDMDKDGNKKEPMKKAVADKKVKETAVSGAPQKSGIPTTAKTSVPGMGATQQDLKKAYSSAALGEGKCNHTPKGKICPVHGLKECSRMEEAAKWRRDDLEGIKKKEGGLSGPKGHLPEEGPQPKGGSGRKIGKGYDSETNVRKSPEGKVPFTSFYQGKSGDFDARSTALAAKGKLVKGKAQSAPQPKDKYDIDEDRLKEAKNAKQQAAIAIAKKKAK
jgi:hypothetical protein